MSEADRLAALERRIDELESREAIARLITAYTEAVRTRAHPSVLDLMTDDCVIELHHADPDDPDVTQLLQRYAGREEIRGSFRAQAGEAARVWPMIHNLRVEVAGDEARSACVTVMAIWPVGKEYVGEYRDTFRRVDGAWRFASRIYVGFGDTSGQFSREAHRAYQAAKDEPAIS